MKLYESIDRYIKSDPARFHMPGHKGKLDPFDITELGFSDNLHNPHGSIALLQEKYASVYGADAAFLLVNGSSSGICAFCTALALKLGRPPRILVSRDCHKSFFSGAFFADALICGVYPEDEMCGTVTPQAIEAALSRLSPKPDAVYITSPNYYGMCADTESIYEITRANGVLLFTDAAHGAHFPFSDMLPSVPKCDCFTVSTHKTLYSCNQTGLLLCRCDMENELQTALNMLQTTSPSYPLMLSIEQGIEKAADYKMHTERMAALRNFFAEQGIKLADKSRSAYEQDITRLCICSDGLAQSGYELDEKLREHGIFAEMSDLYCTVLITTPYDSEEWYSRLMQALLHIKSNADCTGIRYVPMGHKAPGQYISIRSAMLSKSRCVNIKEAAGHLSAKAVGVYPPGTALIFPGERITDAAISALLKNSECGGELFGIENENKILVCD